MSGKFMKIKRIVIPTLTMVIIASQLFGCAAASQSELLQMLNKGDQIEIEVALPAFAEDTQGTLTPLLWEQLALLTTNPELRNAWDDILGITVTDTGKNGILYVNAEGENEPNNTLRVAMHNKDFSTLLSDTEELSQLELSNAVLSQYVDIEADEIDKAIYAGINGYFNLLPDSQPNYANPDSTLQRNEFMAMVFRAETPATDTIELPADFIETVGESEYNEYAAQLESNSYLDIESKSLDNLTYNGTITRAEAIYTLVTRYFSDDFNTTETKGKTPFTDAKNGGDIASKQKFDTEKDHWKSYELTYALQNPDKGLPTDLYKALLVAKDKGLVTSETRWDEALTRSEAVELLINTYKQETGVKNFSAKQGTVSGYEVSDDDPTAGGSMGSENLEGDDFHDGMEEEANALDKDLNESDGVVITEEFDKDMYATKNCNIRTGDGTNFEKLGTLEYATMYHVTGKTANGWYRLSWSDKEAYVSGQFLSETDPLKQSSNGGGSGSNGGGISQEEIDDFLDEMEKEHGTGGGGNDGTVGTPENPAHVNDWGDVLADMWGM